MLWVPQFDDLPSVLYFGAPSLGTYVYGTPVDHPKPPPAVPDPYNGLNWANFGVINDESKKQGDGGYFEYAYPIVTPQSGNNTALAFISGPADDRHKFSLKYPGHANPSTFNLIETYYACFLEDDSQIVAYSYYGHDKKSAVDCKVSFVSYNGGNKVDNTTVHYTHGCDDKPFLQCPKEARSMSKVTFGSGFQQIEGVVTMVDSIRYKGSLQNEAFTGAHQIVLLLDSVKYEVCT